MLRVFLLRSYTLTNTDGQHAACPCKEHLHVNAGPQRNTLRAAEEYSEGRRGIYSEGRRGIHSEGRREVQ